MAGFLDSKERVIDMVLTGVGKNLLFQGDLRFIYWIPFDDEVDYDPFISESGSLTPEQLASVRRVKIEDPVVREAVSGYRDLNSSQEDRTNVNRPMFTVPANQPVIPEMKLDGVTSGTLTVRTKQQKVQKYFVRENTSGSDVLSRIGPIDAGVQRFGSEHALLEADYTLGSYPREFDLEGFLVTVYHSGSEGYEEILPNRDSSGSVVFSNDMKVEVP